ncbi:MAG: hypothetical protein ACRD21_11265, partial [Vicinamibacteria bacterium]
MRSLLASVFAGVLFFQGLATAMAPAQTSALAERKPASIEVSPPSLRLEVGQKQQLQAVVKDEDGNVLSGARVIFFSGARTAVGATPSGLVEAYRPGEHRVIALSPFNPFEGEPDSYTSGDPGIRTEVIVTVPLPPLASLEFVDIPSTIYAGTTLPIRVEAADATGARRGDVRPALSTSDPQIATTDGIGEVTFLKPGTVAVTASAESVKTTRDLVVEENPITSIELTTSREEARTGDVIHFRAAAKDVRGQVVEDAPVTFLLANRPDPNHPTSVGAGAPAHVTEDGRFVAEQPGIYTVLALAGRETARESVHITPRAVQQRIEVVGHAPVGDRVTSDLWVWEGVDGRDYAVHGTWNAEGHTYFYDVTDPSQMELIDKVQVDARTVNDVKVSEDGRICVISREGASNRRNGIVILDVTNPRDVQILSQFDDQLTGGVHNV